MSGKDGVRGMLFLPASIPIAGQRATVGFDRPVPACAIRVDVGEALVVRLIRGGGHAVGIDGKAFSEHGQEDSRKLFEVSDFEMTRPKVAGSHDHTGCTWARACLPNRIAHRQGVAFSPQAVTPRQTAWERRAQAPEKQRDPDAVMI
jgi:hypothetical protein